MVGYGEEKGFQNWHFVHTLLEARLALCCVLSSYSWKWGMAI
jgi:hypothetical protein